jgi:hypothetical protein
VSSILSVLWLGWLCGSSILFSASLLAGFGDPVPGQETLPARLLVAASLCWFGVPVLGLALALASRRQVTSIVFAGTLIVALAMAGVTRLYGLWDY